MPEIVEVFLLTQYLQYFLKNKMIINIKILGGRYSKSPMKGYELINKEPLLINGIYSKGKFIWFELKEKENEIYILNTLGLDGGWSFIKTKNSHIEFTLEENIKLYYCDKINFGTMEITNDISVLNKKLNKLGDDLLNSFTEKEFRDRLYILTKKKHKGNIEIIKVLMNQNKDGIGAGIGNYLSVEILYNAKISPYTTIIDIYNNIQKCNTLSKSIKYIIKLSLMTAYEGYIDDFDPIIIDWIKKLRQSGKINIHPDIDINNSIFTYNVYQRKEDKNGNPIKKDKIINGRTTHWCPVIQIN